MTTKDEFLFLKNSQQCLENGKFQTAQNGNQYSNLNLNQKCSYDSAINSHSKSYNNKQFASTQLQDSALSDNYEKRKELIPPKWEADLKVNDKAEQQWLKNCSNNSSTNNKSNLSLHIATYEKSDESNSFDGKKNENTKNEISGSIRNEKTILTSPFITQNPFEFPTRESNKMSEPELSQYSASQRLLNPDSASSNRQHHKKQQSDDAQIAQQLYNAHLSDQGFKKQRPNNTQIVQQKYLSRSSLGMSNNHLNDTINSQRSYSSYVHTQPVLSHSFNYAISMHDFLKRTWIDLPELKSEITDFKLHAQLLKNAEKMEISKLTSCQSILMTLFFAGDRSLDYIVHAPHLSGVTVSVAFCMVDYVMDYKEYDHTFQKSFAPMVIVLCESDSDVYRTYLGFSQVAEKTGVSVYNIQQKPRKPQNVEKRKVCDILIASPVIVTDLINKEEINVSRVRFVFADWADKVFKAFGLQSTTKLIRYLGKENNAVRILGCEHIYESRREFYYESCRESPIELRVERPNGQ